MSATKFSLINFFRKNIVQIVTIIGIIILPYYLFEGQLFIGGDDTRLFYIYPLEYIKNIAFFSWTSFSSFGTHNPNQFSLPFLFIWSIITYIFKSPVIVDYLSFSLPIIIGYLSFQKFTGELFEKRAYSVERYIGSMVYVFSPLTIVHQTSVFLITIWFFAIFPRVLFYLFKFTKTGKYKYIYLNTIICIIFSLGFYAIPWVVGALIPLFLGFVVAFFIFDKKEISKTVKRIIIFLLFLLLSQLLWLIPFASSLLIKS
jgi:hypothetical protein